MSNNRNLKPLKQLCAARYPSNLGCVRPAEQNSKWCSTHEEIEGKLLKLYKRHTTALESDIAIHKLDFSARSRALKGRTASGGPSGVLSLEELRTWYADARHQWVLATRTLDTRVRHHNAFYDGGDAGHLQYLDFLRSLIMDLEDMMHKCDELGYELLVQKEHAGWIQRAPPAAGPGRCGLETNIATDCGETLCAKRPSGRGVAAPPRVDDRALPTPPPSPTLPRRRRAKQANQAPEIDGSEETAYRDLQKRETIVQRLCAFLQPESGAICRPEVFATFFRRAIARSPSLFVRARTWESQNYGRVSPPTPASPAACESHANVVAAFISSDALTTGELERLAKRLPFVRGESISAELIRGAIADVFRGRESQVGVSNTEAGQNRIPLLGGWIYEKPWSGPMHLDAWDMMHQLIACAGCALGTSWTFSEALQVRRCAFVGGRTEDASRLGVAIPTCLPAGAMPRFPRWQDACSPPEIAMRILNVWLAADNRKAKRSELKRFTPKTRGIKPTYSEHQERHWMYLRMRWSERRLISFLSSLDASDEFDILAQRRTKPAPTHVHVPTKDSDAWVSRVRSGTTPVSRRSARWTTSTVFKMEIFEYFRKQAPETKAGLTYLDQDDVLEAVVMDNSNGEWSPFLQNVTNVLVSACGYDSLDSMLTGEL
ncbi:hypothetical protein FRC08_003514 [Ceratobasidium sp. 394]|nr:hypothetical protein FRC08_003514 [Ceratobasidium sp. 394]KAG9098432.1 hypothetical protein FS749_003838 [Ceratobasidium sp. UAMH 11750]